MKEFKEYLNEENVDSNIIETISNFNYSVLAKCDDINLQLNGLKNNIEILKKFNNFQENENYLSDIKNQLYSAFQKNNLRPVKRKAAALEKIIAIFQNSSEDADQYESVIEKTVHHLENRMVLLSNNAKNLKDLNKSIANRNPNFFSPNLAKPINDSFKKPQIPNSRN